MGSESLQYNFPDNQTIFGERVSAKQFVDDQAILWEIRTNTADVNSQLNTTAKINLIWKQITRIVRVLT